jgi:hypothetical protein
MLDGMLVLATLILVGGLLYGAYREAKKEWRSGSWNHRGAV